MALKTGEKPVNATPPVDDGVLLELAMYAHYTWEGVTYESGTAYKFRRDDAIQLLGDQDYGRPIWKRYNPPKAKTEPRMPIVDQTSVTAIRARVTLEEASLLGTPDANKPKRIDVGTDDEIADILNRPEVDASGDVTV